MPIFAPKRVFTEILMVSIAAAFFACSENKTIPEQQIGQLNESAELAAEARDVSTLKEMVSARFKAGQYDKNSIVRLVQFYLLRHNNIHLYSLTKSLQVLDEDNAKAEVLVAMAGKPVERADQLIDLRADLIRFNVSYLRDQEEWKVVGAEWGPATVDDFL